MDITQLQEYFAYRYIGKDISVIRNSRYNTPSLLVLVVQILPFVIQQDIKTQKLQFVSGISGFMDLAQQNTKPAAKFSKKQSLIRVLKQLNNINNEQVGIRDVDFNKNPILYVLKGINEKEPINRLQLSNVTIQILAEFMTERLQNAGIDPFVFVTSCYDYENKSNHFVDILLCRQLFYEAIQHNRIDCIIINENIFKQELKKLQDYEDLQRQTQQFSSYINCRKCHKYTITMYSIQTSLGLDEISKMKATCHSCGHRFITKG